ncbi:hypothetical protein A3E69_03875, partial [Candidatus Roizmanbacteria bacterium RIFCSPHIGHO2_12_FULL_40_130]
GKVTNIDFLASAIKEGINDLSAPQEKEVCLILPQESFHFLRTEVPADLAPAAISSFVEDKARASVASSLENYYSDFFVRDADKQKQISYFAVGEETLQKYVDVLQLLSLKLSILLPETLAIFKLFEKTLRKEKKEAILYAHYAKDILEGVVFDSGGLLIEEKWVQTLGKEDRLEEVLKKKKEELEEKGVKLNRIILSGEQSDKVRQDTFTKSVGVWTNPLKRIIPDFYAEHLKALVSSDKPFPILSYDVCFGAYVFSQENKEFRILKKPFKAKGKSSFSVPTVPIFKREVGIFFLAFIASFLIFFGLSKINFGGFSLPKVDTNSLTSIGKPSPTTKPTVVPSPTPAFKKEELKIKVLNGSGTVGKATEVRDILKEVGYQEILTDNADNFDYATTIIQIKPSVKTATGALVKDLSENVGKPKIETLNDEEASDIVIIIGSDFK